MTKHCGILDRVLLIVFVAQMVMAPSATAAVQALPDDHGCDDIGRYFEEVYWGTVRTEDRDAIERVLETDDPLTLRRTQQLESAEALERWAEELEAVPEGDVPIAVRDWHDARVARLSVMSNLFYTLAEGGGAFDLMMYTDTMEDLSIAVEEGWNKAERMCGEAWASHFSDAATSEESVQLDYDGISFAQPPVTQMHATPEASPAVDPTGTYAGATLGDPNAPVTFVIYADYQCHFCVQFHEDSYPKIVEDFVREGDVKIEFREFPALGVGALTNDGNESAQAAEASLCAGEQDAYLEFHDTLYANFGGVNLGGFSNHRLSVFADNIGLDRDAFRECLESGRYEAAVIQSIEEGRALGISATPMFIIDNGNGEPNVIQQTSSGYDLLKRQIQVAIDTAP